MTKTKAALAKPRKAETARKAASPKKSMAKAAKPDPIVFANTFANGDPENAGEKQKKDTRFKPGVSGNPAGKPKGLRHKLTQDFIRVLAKDFAEHGESVLQNLRETNEAAYVKAITAILPKIIEIEDEDGNSTGLSGVLLITKTRIADLIDAGQE